LAYPTPDKRHSNNVALRDDLSMEGEVYRIAEDGASTERWRSATLF